MIWYLFHTHNDYGVGIGKAIVAGMGYRGGCESYV